MPEEPASRSVTSLACDVAASPTCWRETPFTTERLGSVEEQQRVRRGTATAELEASTSPFPTMPSSTQQFVINRIDAQILDGILVPEQYV
jgi:hypothetical protein